MHQLATAPASAQNTYGTAPRTLPIASVIIPATTRAPVTVTLLSSMPASTPSPERICRCPVLRAFLAVERYGALRQTAGSHPSSLLLLGDDPINSVEGPAEGAVGSLIVLSRHSDHQVAETTR